MHGTSYSKQARTILAYNLATKRSRELYYYNRDLGHYFGLEEALLYIDQGATSTLLND